MRLLSRSEQIAMMNDRLDDEGVTYLTNYYPNADYASKYTSEQKLDYIEQKNHSAIIKQAKDTGALPASGKVPWIIVKEDRNGEVKVKILCPILAEHIRQTTHYIFARNDASGGVMRYLYSNGYYKLVSDDEMKGFIKDFIPLPLQKICEIDEVLRLLYTDRKFHHMDELNPEDIINFQNGIFNKNTWMLEPHDPKNLCTIQIPCNYNPNAPIPETGHFDRYIKHLSSNDESVENLFMQFIGVTLSNVCGYRMKKALLTVGQGNTGKTTLRELAIMLIGASNNASLDMKDLEKNRFGTAQLYGKRLAGVNDMGYATIDELKMLKMVTGGDSIFAEYKGQNGFSFRYKGVMWFGCNELPRFGGDRGQWVYDRLAIVQCNNPVEKLDKTLLEKMYSEREYIVSRAIDALKRVIQNGYEYDIPECCKKHNDEYQWENNSFLRFIQECAVKRKDGYSDKCTRAHVFKAYSTWCRSNNNGYAEPKKEAIAELERRGVKATKINGEYYYPFTLSQDTKIEYTSICGYLGAINKEDGTEELPFVFSPLDVNQ